MMDFVSWDDDSQYMESHKSHVPNHQPDGRNGHDFPSPWFFDQRLSDSNFQGCQQTLATCQKVEFLAGTLW